MEQKRPLFCALALALVVPLAGCYEPTGYGVVAPAPVVGVGYGYGGYYGSPGWVGGYGTAAAIATAVTAGAAAITTGAIVMAYTPAEAITMAGIAMPAIMAFVFDVKGRPFPHREFAEARLSGRGLAS